MKQTEVSPFPLHHSQQSQLTSHHCVTHKTHTDIRHIRSSSRYTCHLTIYIWSHSTHAVS